MNESMRQALLFIFQTVFDLYLFVVLLRFVLQYMQISFLNPIAQFTFNLTEPVLKSCRGFIPRTRAFDLPLIIYLIILVWLKLLIVGWLRIGVTLGMVSLFFLGLAEVVRLTINLFFYAILLSVILSWVSPQTHSPITTILYRLTEPVLSPVRKILPPLGGFDLSPIFVIIALKALDILLIGTLLGMAYS